MPDGPPIDPLIEKLFEKTSAPSNEVSLKLSAQLSVIRSNLADFAQTDALLEDIFKRTDIPATTAALIMASDWERLDREQTLKYLVSDIRPASIELDKSITTYINQLSTRTNGRYPESEMHIQVNDLDLILERNISCPVLNQPQAETFWKERDLFVVQTASIVKNVRDEKQQRNDEAGVAANPIRDTKGIYSILEMSEPGDVITVEEQTKALRQKFIESGVPADRLEEMIQGNIKTFIPRDMAASYLFRWKWHCVRRVKARTDNTYEHIKDSSVALTSENLPVLNEIIEDIGGAKIAQTLVDDGMKEVKLRRLVGAYISMDELGKTLSDENIVYTEDAFHRNLDVYEERTSRSVMGAFFAVDHGKTLSQLDASEKDDYRAIKPRPPSIANFGERDCIDYFRRGFSSNDHNSTKHITFKQVSDSLKKLATAYFHATNLSQDDELLEAANHFRESFQKMQDQFSDLGSEKFFLVDKKYGFLGFAGRVADTANIFLPKEFQITLPEKPDQRNLTHLTRIFEPESLGRAIGSLMFWFQEPQGALEMAAGELSKRGQTPGVGGQ